MVCRGAESSIGGQRTDLHIIRNGTLTGRGEEDDDVPHDRIGL
ncbi:hypothetical protein TNCV_1659591, partial [Trichonephila clavipes]